MNNSRSWRAFPGLAVVLAAAIFSSASAAEGGYVAFSGAKQQWHGFDRYDYFMDDSTLAIKEAAPGNPPAGQRRCTIVVPKTPAAGNPWSWRGCYWDHQPQAEIELLKRGFHIGYVSVDGTTVPGKQWEAWYDFLTKEHGLHKKPAFIGMSRGGSYEYNWGVHHPDKVGCICFERYDFSVGADAGIAVVIPHKEAAGRPWVFRADFPARDDLVMQALLAKGVTLVAAPGGSELTRKGWDTVYKFMTNKGFSKKPIMAGDGGAALGWATLNADKVSFIYCENPIVRSRMTATPPILDNLAALAKAKVPLVSVCGSQDPSFKDGTQVLEKKYKDLGGTMTVIVKEGEGHYPLSPKDPKPVVDLIMAAQESK